MTEYTTEEFYKFVISVLEEITEEVVRENPNASSLFPCIVCPSPMRYDERAGDSIPVLTRFSISPEAWADKVSTSISLIDEVDKKLRGYNFTRTGTPIDFYDDVTRKHRYGGSYEVFYNALNNSFEKIRK